MDNSQFESMAKKLTAMISSNLGDIPDGIRENVKTSAEVAFQKMDLVTREEFEVQKAVLQRTRAKLDKLEEMMGKLEEDALP